MNVSRNGNSSGSSSPAPQVKMICMQRLVKVDGKIRTDMNFPTGFMDVVTLEKTNQHFRMLSARFSVHPEMGSCRAIQQRGSLHSFYCCIKP